MGRVNYRHAFHAGNHADVLKHVVLLAWIDALLAKEGAVLVLDTHAGRGMYALDGIEASKTSEAQEGIARLWAAHDLPRPLARLCEIVRGFNREGGLRQYPGSPMLALACLRPQDRLLACELQPLEAEVLSRCLAHEPRASVHRRDGYEAVRALLPPTEKRGLVLIDPPYEAQAEEYPRVLSAVETVLARWPMGGVAVWYPIKQRRELARFLREAARIARRGLLCIELLVRPDDSPLRLNGSGMLLFHPPYRIDATLAGMLPSLVGLLGESRPSQRLQWLQPPP